MKDKEKAKELALTLLGEDQNTEPLVEVLIEMAQWKKKQMMKDALEAYVCTNFDKTRKIPCSTEWGGRIPWSSIFENCNVGDKVKLIIIKED